MFDCVFGREILLLMSAIESMAKEDSSLTLLRSWLILSICFENMNSCYNYCII